MPGPEGKEAAALLKDAQANAVATLVGAAGPAVERAMREGRVGASLFNEGEREAVSSALASVLAAGDLLGRVRARKLMERAAGGARKYAEAGEPGIFAAFAEGVPALPPRAAIDYFRKLEPKLGIDPERGGANLERQAFTLAASTEETLTAKVQDLIARALESGGVSRPAEDQLVDLLAAAGVTPQSSGYSEMVVRTNAADAYNAGAWQEFSDSADEFPAWEYLAVADSRSRQHHAARSGKFYPASTAFNEVRGADIGDVANCRCSFRPVHKSEWAVLQRRGAGFSNFSELYAYCDEGPNKGKPGPCPKDGGAPPKKAGKTPAKKGGKAHPLEGLSKEQAVAKLIPLVSRDPSTPANPMGYDQKNYPPGVDGPKLAADVAGAIEAVKKSNPFDRPNIAQVYEAVKASHPGLTLFDFQSSLAKMSADRTILLTPHTQGLAKIPDPTKVMPLDREPMWYLNTR